MKKGFITVLLSVLLSGLTAYAIVKTTAPAPSESQQTVLTPDGQTVRTVNLSLSDYPDLPMPPRMPSRRWSMSR